MANPLQVRTLFGELQGDWADTKQHIRVFKGVPYARPPVGELRFKPPQAPHNWQECVTLHAFLPPAGNSTVVMPLSGVEVSFRAAKIVCT